MANDFRRLKEEADIEEVVNYLGLDTYPKGSVTFLLCPNPHHDDSEPTNCYYKKGWNNLYCYACEKSIQAIDLIMYKTGCDYGSAADILWKLEGRPSWYKDDSWKTKNKNIKQKFSLTGKECKIIGITLPHKISIPKKYTGIREYFSDKMPKGYVYDDNDIDGYILSEKQKISWEDFWTENEFKQLVRNKCIEKLQSYQYMDSIFINEDLFKEEKEIINDIFKRATAK